MNFLGLKDQYCDSSRSHFVILPIPLERTTSYGKGAKFGPDAIIKASNYVELFDEVLGQKTYKSGVYTADPVVFKGLRKEEVFEKIESSVSKFVSDDKFVFCLGGEHSITAAVVSAYKKKWTDFSVLHLDAHADLRDSYEGDKFSHASVMRRVSELCPIVSVGIRSISEEEVEWLPKSNIDIFWAHRIFREAKDKKKISWIDKVVKKLKKNVFISLDVDVFDPSIIPSTGTPEPGGLDWYQVTGLLEAVINKRNVVGCDVLELAPIDGLDAPNFLVAKLIYRIMGLVDRKR